MARNFWNKNTPDVVGLEFLGVGVVSNVIRTEDGPMAVRFKAQRSGEVDQIAVYSGPLTNNPIQSPAHFTGHRTPFVVDLYPASGFDIGPTLFADTLTSNIVTATNAVDNDGTVLEGDELAVAQDGNFVFQQGTIPLSIVCEFPTAATYSLTRRISSVHIQLGTYRPLYVRRVDQSGTYLWTRLLDFNGWAMSEIKIEAGTTTPYVAWTPSEIRQFALSVGNRRIRLDATDAGVQIVDYLALTVYASAEKRAGTAIIEPTTNYQWSLVNLVQPGTVNPAKITSGGEYILLLRSADGVVDFGGASAGRWDASTLKDKRPGSTFVHFSDLDWDSYTVSQWSAGVQQELNTLQDGLPPARLINDVAQTVDTQPYEITVPVVPFATSSAKKVRQSLTVPAGTTEYAQVRLNVALLKAAPGAPADKKSVFVEIVNDADTLIAGPVAITEAVWDASPVAGSDIYNDPYRTVSLRFAAAVDINEAAGVNAKIYLDSTYVGNIAWRIACALSSRSPITGSDQTSSGAATGWAFIPPTNVFTDITTSAYRGDLEVSLLSQAPKITGIGVTGLSQPVTGGACDPCNLDPTDCRVTSIKYNHVCWPATTLTGAKFGYYELQRQEPAISPDWSTITIISPTGTPATGVAATGVPHCFDDYSHAYDTQVCYRVRQQRNDGTLSDFVDTACVTTPSPTGADIIITAPDDPSLNVAFPEAYGGRLPIEKSWENLDANQTILKPIYGRDGQLAFKPSERLGLRWKRQVLVSALCTPTFPSLDVVEGIRNITSAPVSTLVVRDRFGNRWYANVDAPSITKITDPILGDIWLVDLIITELAAPVFIAQT